MLPFSVGEIPPSHGKDADQRFPPIRVVCCAKLRETGDYSSPIWSMAKVQAS